MQRTVYDGISVQEEVYQMVKFSRRRFYGEGFEQHFYNMIRLVLMHKIFRIHILLSVMTRVVLLVFVVSESDNCLT